MTPVGHVIYLHGFASSPGSSKAARFGQELVARGVGFSCPDLNLPAFETLTVTRMLTAVEGAIESARRGPIAIVGASLGGFVALHAAARDRSGRVDRLVLLAPAVDFGGNRLKNLGPHGIEEWRESGSIEVMHYAYGGPRRIGFGLYADAANYDAFDVVAAVPTLCFQGRHDVVVDPVAVERWASSRPNVTLRLLNDDHQLNGSIETIWRESADQFGLTR